MNVKINNYTINNQYNLYKFNEFQKFKKEIVFLKINRKIYKKYLIKNILYFVFYLVFFLPIIAFSIYSIIGNLLNKFNPETTKLYLLINLSLLGTLIFISLIYNIVMLFIIYKKQKTIDTDNTVDTCVTNQNFEIWLVTFLKLMDKHLSLNVQKKLHHLIMNENKFLSYKTWFKYDADWFIIFAKENNVSKMALRKSCIILLTLKYIDINSNFIIDYANKNHYQKSNNVIWFPINTVSIGIFTIAISSLEIILLVTI